MTGYTKLFQSIITSSIWCEAHAIRIVWITMLALRNAAHVVEASVPGLAHVARVSLDDCKTAIALLEAPDVHSRSTDFDGRRIEKVDGGWKILNGEVYRQKMNEIERREYNRIKQAEFRERQKGYQNTNPEKSAPTRFEKPTREAALAYAAELKLPTTEVASFFDHYDSNGWKISGRAPMKDWQASMRNWKKNHDSNRYTNRGTGRQGFDRNKGTANEGNADRYAQVPSANQ